MTKSGLTYLLVFISGAIGFVIVYAIINGGSKIVASYNEKGGVIINQSLNNVEISSSSDTIYVKDEWKKDSIRIKKEIFETKMNIHSCENVISTMNGYSNLEYYIGQVQYDKQVYSAKLDSLLKEEKSILNDTLRKNSKEIDYIKTTCIIIENRK